MFEGLGDPRAATGHETKQEDGGAGRPSGSSAPRATGFQTEWV